MVNLVCCSNWLKVTDIVTISIQVTDIVNKNLLQRQSKQYHQPTIPRPMSCGESHNSAVKYKLVLKLRNTELFAIRTSSHCIDVLGHAPFEVQKASQITYFQLSSVICIWSVLPFYRLKLHTENYSKDVQILMQFFVCKINDNYFTYTILIPHL